MGEPSPWIPMPTRKPELDERTPAEIAASLGSLDRLNLMMANAHGYIIGIDPPGGALYPRLLSQGGSGERPFSWRFEITPLGREVAAILAAGERDAGDAEGGR